MLSVCLLVRYWNDRIAKVDRDELVSEVRHCRMAKCFKAKDDSDQKMKLTLAFAPPTSEWSQMDVALRELLVSHAKLEPKTGPPPRSGLEREAQRLLDLIDTK